VRRRETVKRDDFSQPCQAPSRPCLTFLQAGLLTTAEVEAVIRRSSGTEHRCSPHHQVASVDVHVIVSQGWYIKFYFIGNPDTMFISVHH